MTWRRVGLAALATAALGILVWLLVSPRNESNADRSPTGPATAPGTAGVQPAPGADESPGSQIQAVLFYVAANGTSLETVERDVPYRENTIEQAKAIVNAQLETVAAPLVSAVPPGTTLRALFITPSGEAYVDFSRELITAHPGGSKAELLTIYTLVDALTANLPAITAVQLLVDGREIDTLAGHVDLRRPLARRVP